MNITLEQAESIIREARRASQEQGEVTTLAVVDTGGNLVALSRMDGAYLISIDTAIGKAYTALALNANTIDINPLIQPGQPLFGVVTSTQYPRPLVPYAGGIVLRSNGVVIGALGVSGAHASQTDHDIAEIAQAVLS